MNGAVRRYVEGIASRLPSRTQEVLLRHALFMLNWSGLRQVPVVLLHGPTRHTGQAGSLLVAGQDPWVQYLPQRFFAGQPKREPLGLVSTRALPHFLDQFQRSADLTIARADRLAGQRIFKGTYLAVPEWVGTKLTVPRNLEELVRSGRSIRNDMTLVRRNKFEPVVTRGTEDFDTFYYSIYLPFSRARYGESAFVREAHDLRRRAHRGGILWLQQRGRVVAAILFEEKGHALDLLALGTINGDLAFTKEGAIAALYYFVIELASKRGLQTVDFRGSRPSLCDGLLRYKSKWGVTLYDKADSYHDLFVRWRQVNGVVTEFLSHTPLIFRDQGGFSAVLGDKIQYERGLWVDGIRKCYRLTKSGMNSVDEMKSTTGYYYYVDERTSHITSEML